MKENDLENDWESGMPPRGMGWQASRSRVHRGDMTPIILHVLTNKEMHGYEIIRTLEEKSHGFWRPSPGSIYPTLQLLEEQDLIVSREEGGKKVYSLTPLGKQKIEHLFEVHPWARRRQMADQFKEIRGIIPDIMKSLKQIAFSGTDEQLKEAKNILQETQERLTRLQSETL